MQAFKTGKFFEIVVILLVSISLIGVVVLVNIGFYVLEILLSIAFAVLAAVCMCRIGYHVMHRINLLTCRFVSNKYFNIQSSFFVLMNKYTILY